MGFLSNIRENKNKKIQDEMKGYLEYAKLNTENILNIITKLEEDTKELIEKYRENTEKRKLFDFGSKSKENKKIKQKIEENLMYLYLIKDYFIILFKSYSGIPIKKTDAQLVIKFSPFFDGINIMMNDDINKNSYNNLGLLNKMENKIKNLFNYDSDNEEKLNDLYFYIEDNYYNQIKELIIPNLENIIVKLNELPNSNEITQYDKSILDKQCQSNESTINFIANVQNINNLPGENKNNEQNKIEDRETICENINKSKCSYCNAIIPLNIRFCPNCGKKVNKIIFCTECGNEVNPEDKFCINCGERIN